MLSNKLPPTLQSFPPFCGQFCAEPVPIAGLLDMSVVSWQVKLGAGHFWMPSFTCLPVGRDTPILLLMVSLSPNRLARAHSQGGLRVPRAARGLVLMGKGLSHLCLCCIDQWTLIKPSCMVNLDSRHGETESTSAWEGLQCHIAGA